MTKKQALTRPSSILDYVQAHADAISALLRAPGGGELMAKRYERQRAADVERKKQTVVAPPAPPAPPSEEPKHTLRRWSAKYEWDAIYGEIARRCIDPKTRQVKVPKNELKLAEDVRLLWCGDTNRSAPGLTDLRDAVHAICVALRKI
jgi:hypothetical protein